MRAIALIHSKDGIHVLIAVVPVVATLLASTASFLVMPAAGNNRARRQAADEPQPARDTARMVDAYRPAKSYQDAGELHIVPDGGAEDEPQPFAVALERPNKVRIHSLGAMVVADGESCALHLRWKTRSWCAVCETKLSWATSSPMTCWPKPCADNSRRPAAIALLLDPAWHRWH